MIRDSVSIEESAPLLPVKDNIQADEKPDAKPQEFSFSKTPRDKKILLISMAMINFCGSTSFSLLGPFFPAEAAKKGASTFVTGMIFGVFELMIFLSSPVFGNFLTRIGSKFMFICGIMVCGLCAILFGLLDKSPDGDIYIVMCFLVRSMEALGASAFVTSLFAIIAHSFPNNVTTVLGFLETFGGLGMMVGPAIGGALYQAGGFRLPFFVLGSFIIFIGCICIKVMPRIDDTRKPLSKSVLYLLRCPYVLLVFFSLSAGSFCLGFLDPTLAQHLSDLPQLTDKTWAIGLMFLLVSGTYTLTAPLFGYISDSLKIVNSMMIVGNLVAVIACLLIGPSPLIDHVVPFTLWVMVISLILFGLGLGCSLIPTFNGLMNGAKSIGMPENLDTFGVVSGCFNSAFSLGALLGPILGGLFVQEVSFEWGFSAAACVLFFAAMLIVLYLLGKRFCCTEASNMSYENLPGENRKSNHLP